MVHSADPTTSDPTTAPAGPAAPTATISPDQHAFDTELPVPSQVRKVALWVVLLLIAGGIIVLAVFFRLKVLVLVLVPIIIGIGEDFL